MKGNPQRDRSQLLGILRKIPEEGLSAAARGILFPELKVRRSRGARSLLLGLPAERRKVCARADAPMPLRPWAPSHLGS